MTTPASGASAEPTAATEKPVFVPGQAFDPRHSACGFRPGDFVMRCRELTGGQKLVFDRLLRLASKTGECFASASWLSKNLGRCLRQVKYDLMVLQGAGLIRNARHGPRGRGMASEWAFPFHVLYRAEPDVKVQSIAPLREGLKVQSSPLKVQDPSLKVQPVALQLDNKKNGTGIESPVWGSSSSDHKERKKESLTLEHPVLVESKPKSENHSVDDDDEGTPGEQLTRWVERRHPRANAAEIVALVQTDLGERGLTLDGDFMVFVRARVTGRSSNPAGMYRSLVREFGSRAGRKTVERMAKLTRDMEQGIDLHFDPAAKYPCCRGTGLTAPGVYCACGVGVLLEQVHKRHPEMAGTDANGR